MARQTRQQRRARRAQDTPLAEGPPRPPIRPTANGSGGPDRERRPARPEERPGGGGFGPARFVAESIAELKKVEWPDQKAVVSGTAVVLIACFIVGAYLWLNDELWKYVVQHILLR